MARILGTSHTTIVRYAARLGDHCRLFQRAQLERDLGRPDPKAIERGIADLLRPLLTMVPGEKLLLHSDDHPAYPRALHRLRAS